MNDHRNYSPIPPLLKKHVIDYIIAENEGLNPPDNSVTNYMRAFEGGFFPDKPFTCYMPTMNKVLLYVAEEQAGFGTGKRSDFTKQCDALKPVLIGTARCIEELERKGYIRVLIRPRETEPLPPDLAEHWRRYENFYMSEIEPLIFACTTILIPRLKLYKYWEQTHNTYPEKKVCPVAVAVDTLHTVSV
jgi:hypothetical protein